MVIFDLEKMWSFRLRYWLLSMLRNVLNAAELYQKQGSNRAMHVTLSLLQLLIRMERSCNGGWAIYETSLILCGHTDAVWTFIRSSSFRCLCHIEKFVYLLQVRTLSFYLTWHLPCKSESFMDATFPSNMDSQGIWTGHSLRPSVHTMATSMYGKVEYTLAVYFAYF